MYSENYVEELKISKKKKLFCNNCKTETNHIYKSSHLIDEYEDLGDDFHMWYQYNYVFWICAGCEHGTLEVIYTDDSLRIHDEDDKIKYHYYFKYFPRRNSNLLMVKRFFKLPEKLKKIYEETINAFNSDLHMLSTVGLRSLIEGICDDKNITGGNLEKKIDGLSNILPQNITTNLHNLRYMGNIAIHNLNPPKRSDLKIGIEISEDLLNFIYELDYKTSQLNKYKKSGKS